MTAAPIDIPLDERGAPDLTLLVRKLGEAAAAARGEEYDPAKNPAHAGYPLITPAIWKVFDEAMAAYQSARRMVLTPAPASNTEDETPPTTFGPIERHWPLLAAERARLEDGCKTNR